MLIFNVMSTKKRSW